MTYGWRKYEELDGTMRSVIAPLYDNIQTLLALVDADSAAFESFQVYIQVTFQSCS